MPVVGGVDGCVELDFAAREHPPESYCRTFPLLDSSITIVLIETIGIASSPSPDYHLEDKMFNGYAPDLRPRGTSARGATPSGCS
jgi:hypothetical protein